MKIRPERGIPIYYNIRLLKVYFNLIRELDKIILKTRLFFKKSHKKIEEWLSNNKIFENYIKKSFSEKNHLFNELFNNYKIDKLISKGRWDDLEIALIFRFLTVKLFLDMIKKSF